MPQTLDLAGQEDAAGHFALLVDSSQSMSRRIDFVREAASRLAGFMRPQRPDARRAILEDASADHRPTDDRATVLEAIARIRPAAARRFSTA